MVLSTKIDIACIQKNWAVLGTMPTVRTQHARVPTSEILSTRNVLFGFRGPHLEHANNSKPKYGQYTGSKLEGFKMSAFP